LRLLLDTHAVLSWLLDDGRLGVRAAREVDDPSNQLLVSAVVVWEVAIKRSLGKLQVPLTFFPDVLESDAAQLPVSLEHAAAVEALPHHHRDPFDRLLIAQAKLERATLVSSDHAMRAYDVPILW
jgi:PIN domain nuclease of toxin-antitoxin system